MANTATTGDFSRSTKIDMEVLLTGEIRLASPPEIFLKISQIIEDPSKTVQDAERVIEHDPGLAARLLRLVNSAFYGFPRRIVSISHAVSLIGLNELRDLVLATVVVERFSKLSNPLMSMREFWQVSVRGALLTRELSKAFAGMEATFVCGLLHEIGRLVIYARIPELARAALLLATAENLEERVAERRIYGFDHYQLGAELLRRWQLPEVIVTTLRHHGRPGEAGGFSRETALVTLALLVSIEDLSAVQASQRPDLGELMDFLHLPTELLAEAMETADRQFESVYSLLMGP